MKTTEKLQEAIEACRRALEPIAERDDYVSRLCREEAPAPLGWLTHGMVSDCSDALEMLNEAMGES